MVAIASRDPRCPIGAVCWRKPHYQGESRRPPCVYDAVFTIVFTWIFGERETIEKLSISRGISPATTSPPSVRPSARWEKRRDWTNSYSWRLVNVTIGNAFIPRQDKGDRPRKHECATREHAPSIGIGVFTISCEECRRNVRRHPKIHSNSSIGERGIRLKFLSANYARANITFWEKQVVPKS